EAEHTSQSDCAAHLARPILYLTNGVPIDNPEEPEHRGKSQYSCFHQQLQVVVVRLIDKEVGIERAELRIYNRECPQSPSENRLFQEHFQSVAIDEIANVAGNFGMRSAHGCDAFTEFRAA